MIREAERHDAQALDSLYRILLPGGDIKVWEDRIEQIGRNPYSFLFVMEESGRIVGTAHLHLCLDAISGDRPFGVVERVIVDPEKQGMGYGKKLMNHIEELCGERRCVKIMLTSNAKRTDAHKFYRSLGYDGEGSVGFKKYLK